MEKALRSELRFLKVRAIHKLGKLFGTHFFLFFKEQLPHLGIIGIHKGNAHVLKPSNFQLPRYLMSCLNKITKHIKGTNCIAFNSEITTRCKIGSAAGILLAMQDENEEVARDQGIILLSFQEESILPPQIDTKIICHYCLKRETF